MITIERRKEIAVELHAYAKVQKDRLQDIVKLQNAGVKIDNVLSVEFYKEEFVEYFKLNEEEYEWAANVKFIVKSGDYLVLNHETLDKAVNSHLFDELRTEDEIEADAIIYIFAIVIVIVISAIVTLS